MEAEEQPSSSILQDRSIMETIAQASQFVRVTVQEI
jgi:hypothetical protein